MLFQQPTPLDVQQAEDNAAHLRKLPFALTDSHVSRAIAIAANTERLLQLLAWPTLCVGGPEKRAPFSTAATEDSRDVLFRIGTQASCPLSPSQGRMGLHDPISPCLCGIKSGVFTMLAEREDFAGASPGTARPKTLNLFLARSAPSLAG